MGENNSKWSNWQRTNLKNIQATPVAQFQNWCLWTVVLEKTLENPLDNKKRKPVSPKGNQSWIFIGRTDAEAEAPILWAPDGKNWVIRKDSDAGKDWRWEEKGTTVDEMVGWLHQLNGHEFGWTPGVGDGQGGLVCMELQRVGHDLVTELNWTEHWSILNIHWKAWCWIWNSNTLTTWCEEVTHLKRPWCWEDWRQEGKGTTEDEMVGWHHWLNGHEFEQAPGVGDGQRSLACCSP